jgi:hypothetical protein
MTMNNKNLVGGIYFGFFKDTVLAFAWSGYLDSFFFLDIMSKVRQHEAASGYLSVDFKYFLKRKRFRADFCKSVTLHCV